MAPTDEQIGGGAALAVLGTITAGAALVVLRGSVDNSVIVLGLAAVVSLSGALGGWRAGVASAIAAAVSFNFFHTEPYLSLRIHDADDVFTTATLLLVGLVAGATSSVASRSMRSVGAARHDVDAVARVARLVAEGRSAADVQTAVRAELLEVLDLTDCTLVADPGDRPVVGHLTESTMPRRYRDGGFEVPAVGIAVPVHHGGTVSYLAGAPVPGAVLQPSRTRVAAALGDLLGAAIVADRTHPASN